MVETLSQPGSTRPYVADFLALTAAAAAVALAAALLFLPWFQFTNHGDIIAIPPDSSGSYGISWSDWHMGSVDQAVFLTFVAPCLSIAAALARVIWRRWTRILLLVGFIVAVVGSVEAFGEASSVHYVPGATTTPGLGLWLFAGAAFAGLVVVATDLVVSSRRAGPGASELRGSANR
jgi:hypothetical protein